MKPIEWEIEDMKSDISFLAHLRFSFPQPRKTKTNTGTIQPNSSSELSWNAPATAHSAKGKMYSSLLTRDIGSNVERA